ncbi:MAG: hypothetical protein KA385_07495 [Vicinamibacteria bacterium]|nr:hypothetical protein [Vicinamibacteria bacterium]
MKRRAVPPDGRGFAPGVEALGTVFILGKGGSGKSVISEGLAALSANRGLKTLLVRIGESLKAPEAKTLAPGPSRHGFHVFDLDARVAMDEYVQHVVKLRPLVERITRSEVYRKFFAAAPGLPELVLLGRIRHLALERERHGGMRYETIIVDCPSSGHGLLMLETPYAALRAMPVGPFARLASDIIEWLKTAVRIGLVAIPEEMAVVEAIEFKEDLLERTALSPAVAFLNRMRQESLSTAAHRALVEVEAEPGSEDGLLLEAALRVQRRTRLEAFHQRRLAKGLGLPPVLIAELPNVRPATVALALEGIEA